MRSVRSRGIAVTLVGMIVAAGSSATQAQQTPAKPPGAFDVVSIKRNVSNSTDYTVPFPAAADGLVIRNINLYATIRFAYNFWREDLIFGIPAWTKTERYDIVAKVDSADVTAWRSLTDEERRRMLQHVLEDRFKLKAHFEQREIPIHVLVVVKNGPKLKPTDPDHPGPLKDADGSPLRGILYTGAGQYTAQAASMAELALDLSDNDTRQVVDRTGLSGLYDFKLQYTPEPGMGPAYWHRTPDSPPLPEFTGPSIFTAVQEQLGLKLEPAKAPVEALVIDQLERPEEN